jgi:hypothetical protein
MTTQRYDPTWATFRDWSNGRPLICGFGCLGLGIMHQLVGFGVRWWRMCAP